MNTKSLVTMSLIIGLLLLFFIGLGGALVPLFVSFAMAYLIFPLIQVLETKGVSRKWGILILFAVLSVAFIVVVIVITPILLKETRQLANDLPRIFQIVASKVLVLANSMGVSVDVSQLDVRQSVEEFVGGLSVSSFGRVSGVLRQGFSSLSGSVLSIINLFFIPIFFFYLISDFEKIILFIENLVPYKFRGKVHGYIELANGALSGYFRGQILVVTVLSIVYSVSLHVMGVQFGLLIGLVTGLLCMIPYVGPIVGAVIAASVSFATAQSGMTVLWILLLFVLVQLIESFILTPKLVGNKVGLSEFATMLALIVGGNLFGFGGMLLAIPVAAVLKVILVDLIGEYKKSELFKQG